MPVARTRVTQETGTWPPDLPVFRAFGDPDDHLRLSVLISDAFREVDPAIADHCFSPQTPWPGRLDALRHLASRARATSTSPYIGVVFDFDGLDPVWPQGPGQQVDLWEDSQCRRHRTQLRDTMLDWFEGGGWMVVRPEITSRAIDRLSAHQVDRHDLLTTSRVSTDSSRLAAWLVQNGHLAAAELERHLDANPEDARDRMLISLVYDLLPTRLRDAAKRLSTFRASQALNGSVGPFPLVTASGPTATPHAVDRETIGPLIDVGLLVREATKVRMPRFVRRFLAEHAEVANPAAVEADHRWICTALSQQPSDKPTEIEVHHHAVIAGDAELSLKTASYYSTDLRFLGARLSRQGRFKEAAAIFEHIVEQDPADAYAWEYLGYNLTRAPRGQIGPEREERVRRAFQLAVDLDRENPLYRGRLLGFQAEVGRDIEVEFSTCITKFSDPAYDSSAVSYFAEAALKGLRRAGNYTALKVILDKWRYRLRRHGVHESLLNPS